AVDLLLHYNKLVLIQPSERMVEYRLNHEPKSLPILTDLLQTPSQIKSYQYFLYLLRLESFAPHLPPWQPHHNYLKQYSSFLDQYQLSIYLDPHHVLLLTPPYPHMSVG